MEICTIGFTKKTAADFFGILKRARIKRLVDVRLNNTSQLAAFAKRDDLAYFLKEICGIEYLHEPLLAPTEEIIRSYRDKEITWDEYEKRFSALLEARKVEELIDKRGFDVPTVLLCSEPEAEHCHRRIVAEYLAAKWGGMTITHL